MQGREGKCVSTAALHSIINSESMTREKNETIAPFNSLTDQSLKLLFDVLTSKNDSKKASKITFVGNKKVDRFQNCP